MRHGIHVCGPDELKVLQQITNSVVQELRQAGLADANLRLRVGRKVFKYASGDVLNVDGIKQSVLASFQN